MYIQDPLYGGYELEDETIQKLIPTFEISRLGLIRQANFTALVFPGATHTRFEHTLGTVYLMDRLFQVLKRKVRLGKTTGVSISDLEEEEQLMKLSAFLHDAYVFPFSHVIEFSFKQIAKTQELKDRMDLYAFDGYCTTEEQGAKSLFLNELNHDRIRNEILKGNIDIERYYGNYYKELYISKKVVPDILNEHLRKKLADIYERKFTGKRYLSQMIDSDIDVDRIDHLARDSYYSGIKHANFNVERLIDSTTIQDGDLTIDSRIGLPQALHLMISRELLYDSYYNDQITRCYEAMFCRALYRLLVDIKSLDIDHLLFLTDEACNLKLLALSHKIKEEQKGYSFNLFQRIRDRAPLELIFEILWPDIRTPTVWTPGTEVNQMFEELRYLNDVVDLEKQIAVEVGIKPEEVLIYRDSTGDDPRRSIQFAEVAVNISSEYMKGPSKNIGHYHNWINQVKEDWKERWSVRIYTARLDKRKDILKSIGKRIPLIDRLA